MMTAIERKEATALIDFWFGPPRSPTRFQRRDIWFKVDPAFDAQCRDEFGPLRERAAAGDCADWALEAAYFGSHGLKLTGQIVDNTAVIPGPGPIAARQKNPQFPPFINNGFNVFPSWYDGLSLKLTKRLSYGLSLLVSYTWSKTLDISDNLSNASLGGNPTANVTRFNLAANKAVAGFDIPQNFVTSLIYTIPGRTHSALANAFISDWNLSAIITHYSGLPFSAFLGSDVANIGTVSGRTTQYPNLVGDPNAIANRSPNLWFNTAAFAQPAQYTFGNAGRNILRTDTQNNVNFSLYKRFRYLEKRDVELRGDFFDLLNNPHFNAPGSSVAGTSTFGKISSAGENGASAGHHAGFGPNHAWCESPNSSGE